MWFAYFSVSGTVGGAMTELFHKMRKIAWGKTVGWANRKKCPGCPYCNPVVLPDNLFIGDSVEDDITDNSEGGENERG